MANPETSGSSRYRIEIIIVAIVLTTFGILSVYSSSSITAFHRYSDPYYFVRKQTIVALMGFAAALFIQLIPLKWLHRSILPLYLATLGLLTLTLFPGFQHKANGAARWLTLFGVTFQPAELAKIALILFMAKSLSRPRIIISDPKFIASSLVFFSLMATPLMLQPDFGSTFLMFTVIYIMFFCARLPLAYTLFGVLIAASAVALAIIKAPYRLARLMSYLDPWADFQKGGFQIIQSYLGFQNGGLLGQGIGESRQKLYFLPEAHTDFIISVIGEEFGLFGVIFIICCFFVFLHAGFRIALNQRDRFKKYLAIGITSLIVAQASINIGVALGALPTKGISLPFVSSGASSLLVFLVSVGILCRLEKGEPNRNDSHP